MFDFGEQRAHMLAHRGFLDGAVLGLEDDRVAVAGLRGEAVGEQVRGTLRVGVGQREVVGVGGAGGLGERVDDDQQDYPADRDVETVGC